MSLEVHIEIKSFNIDDIIKNIKEISKNYTITKIKFSKSNTILMFINLDIICEICPFLTHLDLGSNNFISLKEFKTNLPKCNVIQDMFSCDCKRVKETREYTFGTIYYYEYTPPELEKILLKVVQQNYIKFNHFASMKLRADREILLKVVQGNYIKLNHFPSMELQDDTDVVLKLVKQDNIPLQLRSLKSEHKVSTKQAYKVRDHETKALNKRFHPTNKSQYNTNVLNQRYQKKY